MEQKQHSSDGKGGSPLPREQFIRLIFFLDYHSNGGKGFCPYKKAPCRR